MPNLNQIAELFERHLANPSDPQPSIELISHSELTAQFFHELIRSGDVINLSVECKVQLLAILGVWCPHIAQEVLEMWAVVEPDSEVTQILRKQVSILRAGTGNGTANPQIAKPTRD